MNTADTPRRQRRTVFGTHAQTCHVWAQQNADTFHGRSGDGRIFFEGASIFSYRPSWTIARFVANRREERAVLINTDNYSVSTAKHTSLARQAIPPGVPIFHVPNPHQNPDNKATRAYFTEKLDAETLSAARARTRAEHHIREAESTVDTANAMAAFFGWRWRLKTPDWSAECFAAAKTRAAKAAAERAADAKRQSELRARDSADRIEAWRNGERAFIYDAPMMLRIKGDQIQTSRGASVPIEHAKRAWPLILRCHDTKTAWHTNGRSLPLGHFRVDSVGTDGTLRAGCHVIPFDEIAGMAAALGLVQNKESTK